MRVVGGSANPRRCRNHRLSPFSAGSLESRIARIERALWLSCADLSGQNSEASEELSGCVVERRPGCGGYVVLNDTNRSDIGELLR